MVKHPWNQQTLLVCADSYDNGIPQGQPGERLYGRSSGVPSERQLPRRVGEDYPDGLRAVGEEA